MSIPLKNLQYKVGLPGMIASTSYKHTRQSIQDSNWVNSTNGNFPFGVAACADPATGKLCLADKANAKFLGVFQDPARKTDQPYYAPKDPVIVCTMGDIWVSVDPAITIKPLTDSVYYIPTAGANLGKFTNVAATGHILLSGSKFATENANGIAILSLVSYNVPSLPQQ